MSRIRMWGSRARQTRTWPWLDSSVHWRRETGAWSGTDCGVGLMGSGKPRGSGSAPAARSPQLTTEHNNEIANARDAIRGQMRFAAPGRARPPGPSAPVHGQMPEARGGPRNAQTVGPGTERGPGRPAAGHVSAVSPALSDHLRAGPRRGGRLAVSARVGVGTGVAGAGEEPLDGWGRAVGDGCAKEPEAAAAAGVPVR